MSLVWFVRVSQGVVCCIASQNGEREVTLSFEEAEERFGIQVGR